MPDYTQQYNNSAAVNSGRRVSDGADAARKEYPKSIPSEKAVLSACLISPGVFEEVALVLQPESFFRPAHQMMFATMREMSARSVPIDPISLSDQLKAKGQLEAVGGFAYLADLSNNTLAVTNWQHHAEIVSRDAMRRELLLASATITSLAYDSPADSSELVGQAEAALFNVTERRVSNTFKDIQTLIIEANEDIRKLADRNEPVQGTPTGFIDVDKLFGGFRGGDLIILAARPAVGKSSFAMNIAIEAARYDSTVALFSLEMSSSQLVQRLLSSEASVSLSRMRSGQLNEADWAQLAVKSQDLANFKLFIDDSPSLSINELRTKARREFRNVERGLIIVDYLQLMQPVIPHPNNRTVEVAEISRGLKVLAKELDVPILALSQLSRSVETRSDKRPMLSDLRESGSIEQDADIVMFLDRSTTEAEAEAENRPPWGEADLIVAKHRNGATGNIKLTFLPEFTKFTNHYDDSSY